MLGYFPVPYSGESLYSLIARFQKHTRCPAAGLKKVLGTLTCNPHIQQKLGALKRLLPSRHPLHDEDILTTRTLFPIFTLGLDPVRTQALRRQFEDSSPGGSTHKLGRSARFRLNRCPICFQEQIAAHGEAYWLLSHQTSTVTACEKHGCRLQPLLPERQIIQDAVLPDGLQPITPERALPWEITHALRCQELLKTPIAGPEVIEANIWRGLEVSGLSMAKEKSCRISEKGLTKIINGFANEIFLHEAGLRFAKNKSHQIRVAFRDRGLHFVELLAFACILNLTAQDLFRPGEARLKRFPCRNPFSDCHLKETIRRPKRKGARFHFECLECKHTYSLLRQDLNRNSIHNAVKSRIVTPGPVWAEKFAELWNDQSVSLISINKRTGLGYRSVSLHAAKLDLPHRGVIDMALLGATKKILLNALQAETLTRSQLLSKHPTEFLMVKRQDLNWFNVTMPKDKRFRARN